MSDGLSGFLIAIEDARGWPEPAMCHETLLETDGAGTFAWSTQCGLPLKGDQGKADRLVLPLRPIWPGFAVDTLLYGAVVFMLYCVPGMVREAVRRHRGACARCGYDVRGSTGSVCPECGASEGEPAG